MRLRYNLLTTQTRKVVASSPHDCTFNVCQRLTDTKFEFISLLPSSSTPLDSRRAFCSRRFLVTVRCWTVLRFFLRTTGFTFPKNRDTLPTVCAAVF
jgi:hypothetical protein